ncbi:MAG TPA: RNA polymerase sigma factor [Bacteroidota bacterium]|nr:RNA polymerase sigma factor [Bacteroidota bacterium]
MHPAEKQEILDTDWKLYLAAKTDRRQFSEIFRMYYPRIFGYALRRTGGVDAAAEIASATFEKAFHGFARFEWREIRLSSWLYRIATNEMNAHYRKRRFRLEIRIVDAADEAAMTACLADDREALEQMSLAEIGEILQRPEGTVKSLISRGTKRLREAWRQRSSEPEAANRAKR